MTVEGFPQPTEVELQSEAIMTISAQTYDNDKRFLWGLCYRMTGSAADADDIVQDTFVRALEKPPTNVKAPLRPWLVKVALNLSRDQLRRRRRREASSTY